MRLKHILFFVWLVPLFYGQSQIKAQCNFILNDTIPDLDTLEYSFEVFGLVNSMLSNPAQSVCEVSLDFVHEYIGDLVIELISPSGQVVTLVGPTTSAISPTNLSRWNITFNQCSDPASPDAGFSDAFDNNQAWQILTTYSGAYYPASGCLEDFNTGSANGTWILRAIDASGTAIGVMNGLSIEFCDNNGSACTPCEADAGTFSVQNISICENEDLDESLFEPIYPGDAPDSLRYSYYYVLHENGLIQEYGTSIISVIDSADVGTYSLCGISIAETDTTELISLLETGQFSNVIQAVESAQATLCADLTDNCIALNLLSAPEQVIRNVRICPGDTFQLANQNFFENGIYLVSVPQNAGCDSTIQLFIRTNNTTAIITEPDSINCQNQILTLDGSNSIFQSSSNYFWYTENGTIISNPMLDTVVIAERERYFLVVNDGQCSDTAFVDIAGDQSFPQVFSTPQVTIDCNTPVPQIQADAFPFDATYRWYLPDGSIINGLQQINATMEGVHLVEVSNEFGCTSVDTTIVLIDTIRPDFEFRYAGADCEQMRTVYTIDPFSASYTYAWTGPNNFMSTRRSAGLELDGFYVAQVTDDNGCSSVDSILHIVDFNIPDATAIATDSIGCGTTGVQITGASSVPGAVFSWIGPQGFSSDEQSPIVLTPGQYTLEVLAPNNCVNIDTVDVFQGAGLFSYTVVNDNIDCRKDSAIIGVIGTDLIYNWLNLPTGMDTSQFVSVFVDGTYQALLTDTISGCTQIAEVEVNSDFRRPRIVLVNDSITCTNPEARYTFETIGGTVDSIFWTLPDLSVLTDSIVFLNTEGEHTLRVVDINGCSNRERFSLVFDTIAPVVFGDAPLLPCADSVQVITLEIDAISVYEWVGPMSFTSSESNPFVYDTGIHVLTATGPNGCMSQYSVNVRPDQDPPDFQLVDEVLTCSDPQIDLTVIPIDVAIAYQWTDTSGILLSTDSILMTTQPGKYFVSVLGANACLAIDSLVIDPPVFPEIQIAEDTINCAEPIAEFFASNPLGGATYEWRDGLMNLLSTDSILNIGVGDPIQLSVTGLNGCTTDSIFRPLVDTISPSALIVPLDEILCKQRVVRLDGTGSIGSDLGFLWSSNDGEILAGVSDSISTVNDIGVYYLTVSDTLNGCMDIDSFMLEESPQSIFDIYLSLRPPACNGDDNAAIIVDSIEGGSGNLQYFLDGEQYPDSILQDLSAGTYLLMVEDLIGCVFDSVITIDETDSVSVELGDEIVIYIGETVDLIGQIDFDESQVTNVTWRPSVIQDSTCINCLTLEVTPLETTIFDIEVTNELGCVISDDVLVQVIERGNLFIPNVFTPNGDGANDGIRIFPGSGIQVVEYFRIFDRWGNLVFQAEDYNPRDPTIAWDGRFENLEPVSAVYTYIARYQLINGVTETKTGDFLLLR